MAWGPIGHMAVANVAYQELTPTTKARVRDLLKLNPEYADWEKQIPAGTSPEDHSSAPHVLAIADKGDRSGKLEITLNPVTSLPVKQTTLSLADPNNPVPSTAMRVLVFRPRCSRRYRSAALQ
jgi:hypothetical protein